MNPNPPPEQFHQTQPHPIEVAVPNVKPYATYIILGITIFVFLLQLAGQYLLKLDLVTYLAYKDNDLIRQGQLWRLITPVFLHGSILHIGFNAYALYVYGRGIEPRFGHGRFLLLYFLSAFAGNVLSFLLTPKPSIGAATAIFGLLAAEGMFIFQNRKLLGPRANPALVSLAVVAGINFFLGYMIGFDNWGLFGGLLGGFLFTWFGGPRWKIEGFSPSLKLVDEREGHGALAGTLSVLLFFIPLAILGWVLVQ